MDRRLACAALLLIAPLALAFRALTQALPPVSGFAMGLALYWLLLGLALRRRPGWSLHLRPPGAVAVMGFALLLVLAAPVGLPALARLSPQVLAVVVLAAALNGALEEAFWRGALMPRARGWGDSLAPGMIFVLWHLAPLAGALAFLPAPVAAAQLLGGAALLAVPATAARLRGGSAGSGALGHALVNLLTFAAVAAHAPIHHATAHPAPGHHVSGHDAPGPGPVSLDLPPLESPYPRQRSSHMFIQTETTPNPATLKFLPGETVLGTGTADFPDASGAATSPLAQRIFSVPGVSGVFLGSDFVTVTKADDAVWDHLKPSVLGAIMEHYQSGAPVMEGALQSAHNEQGGEDAEIVIQIKELLDTRVRPAVAQDGGDITFHGFDRGVVYLHMQGACAGCPSSTLTLKMGIENLLRHYIPEVTEVRPVG